MKHIILIAFGLAACGRMPRECTFVADGLCIHMDAVGRAQPMDLTFAVRATVEIWAKHYRVPVDLAALAYVTDLYAVCTSTERVLELSRSPVNGAYVWGTEEIYITCDVNKRLAMATIGHELIHVLNRHLLWPTHPVMFEPWGLKQAEEEHLTKGAFAFGVPGYESVESALRNEILEYLREN